MIETTFEIPLKIQEHSAEINALNASSVFRVEFIYKSDKILPAAVWKFILSEGPVRDKLLDNILMWCSKNWGTIISAASTTNTTKPYHQGVRVYFYGSTKKTIHIQLDLPIPLKQFNKEDLL